MAIKITKDQAGVAAIVEGIDVNPIPLNAFLCSVTAGNGGITIFNPNAPNENGDATKIFSNVPFTEFVKSDGTTPVDADDLKVDIDAQLVQSAPTDVNVGYKGVYDASTGLNPSGTSVNGDWYYIAASGGTISGVTYQTNDIIKYNEDNTSWEKLENLSVRVADIEESALSQYDIYVDADYTGAISTGSSLQPYTSLATAISNSTPNDSILIQGVNVIASEIVLPHSLYFYGANNAEIKYTSYSVSNGDLLSINGSNSETFEFYNIKFTNAGNYGLYIRNVEKFVAKDCEFINNGWNGTTLNTILDSATSGLLGYDSTQAQLQAFYAGSNASNGGAVRVEDARVVELIGNVVKKNLRGLRVQDCGVNGYGYVTRNQVSENIESGIYLASNTYDAVGGCENFTVYNNASKYNANNGILVVGGINNVISLNIIEGNWNAGIMGWHVSNTRFRDLDLTNNNRTLYNGIGNNGDADSSIQISGDTARAERSYILDVLSTEVYNTGVGAIGTSVGLTIGAELDNITGDYSKNLINIDNVGFKNQDYAIGMLCDLDIIRVTIGDCRYIDTTYTNVYAAAGYYYSLPFSNHHTNTKDLDFSLDNTNTQVIIKEGINASTINTYGINTLQAYDFNGVIRILLKDSKKIQIEVPETNVSIDASLLTGTIEEKVNELNALLQHSGSSTGQPPVITSSLAVTLQQGSTLNYELTADYGVGYEWDLSNVSGITTVEGHIRNLIGGSNLAVGTYNIPVKAINYNGEDSEVLVLTVSTPPFSNNKSINFANQDYLGANASLLSSTLGRTGNGSGASDAWSISMWFKPSINSQGQTIFYFGDNDTNNGGYIQLMQINNNNGNKALRLRYGSNNNCLKMQTVYGSLTPNTWQHILITYDGGTTGASSGDLSNYYNRFKIYIDGSLPSRSNSHINYGYTGGVYADNLRVGRFTSGNYMRDCRVDELAIFNGDQSANIADIYNSAVPFDLSTLTTPPLHWWRMGDGDTYPFLQDNGTVGNCVFQMYNQTAADIVSDTP